MKTKITNEVRVSEQNPVVFTKLADINSCPNDALLVSDVGSLPKTYIGDVIHQGLASGSYNGLKEKIDSLFKSGYCSRRSDTLMKINATLIKKENRRKLINLLRSEEAIENILENSYVHHNGFSKIVLLNSDYFKLRYHIFESAAENVPQENIHDHRWPFASTCLEGELVCKTFHPSTEDGITYEHYHYSPVDKNGEYKVKRNGSTNLVGTNPLYFRKGNIYYLPENTLHRVINQSKKRVITMVITGTPVKNECNLFTEHEFEETSYSVERFSKCDIVTALTELQYL